MGRRRGPSRSTLSLWRLRLVSKLKSLPLGDFLAEDLSWLWIVLNDPQQCTDFEKVQACKKAEKWLAQYVSPLRAAA